MYEEYRAEVAAASTKLEARARAIEDMSGEVSAIFGEIRSSVARYVSEIERNPDAYPFTHVIDNAEHDLDLAEGLMRDVIGYIKSANYFAQRLGM